ncbi:hypothetical protein IMG5_019870, partial [Ichthyophthirius multifiliis]
QYSGLFSVRNNQNSIHKTIVLAFQSLWNCNNSSDILELTGEFDSETEQKLLKSPTEGFQNICEQCEIENCFKCSKDQSKCLTCKNQFELKDNQCIPCTISNCEQCLLEEGVKKCLECKSPFILYKNQCLDSCPDSYIKTKKTCLSCQQGEYVTDLKCEKCIPFCETCNNSVNCEKCFIGYSLNIDGICIETPEKCSSVDSQCPLGQFRSIEYPYECENCHDSCEKCIGPSASECATCKGGLYLSNGFCIQEQEEVVEVEEEISQNICHFSCQTCSDQSENCLKCQEEMSYFIKTTDGRMQCFLQCPEGFSAKEDSLECVSNGQQIVEEKCALGTFLNSENKCESCAKSCVLCSQKSTCEECILGFYWNIESLECEKCHFSCSKCTGSKDNECTLCTSYEQVYPNEDGMCLQENQDSEDENIYEIDESEEIGDNDEIDEKQCPSNSQQQSFHQQFDNLYAQDNALYANIQLVDDAFCEFQNFKNVLPQFADSTLDCKNSDFQKSMLNGQEGEIVLIYAIILAKIGVFVENQRVNPINLVNIAHNKKFFKNVYSQRLTLEIKEQCQSLFCQSQLNESLSGLEDEQGNSIFLEEFQSIDFEVECSLQYEKGYVIEDYKKTEIEQAIQTLEMQNDKIFVVLQICGLDNKDIKFSYQKAIAQQYLGNGFFNAIFVKNSAHQQQTINIFGASQTQNENHLQNCGFQNQFYAYKVTRMNFLRTGQYKEKDLSEEIKAEAQKEIIDLNELGKCSCLPTNEFILQLENQVQLITSFSKEQTTFLTNSISALDLKSFFFRDNLDIENMMENSGQISQQKAQIYYLQYLEQLVNNMKEFYQKTTFDQCLINILVGIAASNGGAFLQEFNQGVQDNDYQKILSELKLTTWCQSNEDKCQKIQQVIISCL